MPASGVLVTLSTGTSGYLFSSAALTVASLAGEPMLTPASRKKRIGSTVVFNTAPDGCELLPAHHADSVCGLARISTTEKSTDPARRRPRPGSSCRAHTRYP